MEFGILAGAVASGIGVVVPVATRYNDNAARLKCLDNLRIIGEGIRKWHLLHDYVLPPGRGMAGFCNSPDGVPLEGNLYAVEPGLNALWDKGRGVISDPSVFACPADAHLEPPPAVGEDFTSPGQLSYAMTGHLYPTDAPNKVIVADKSDKGASRGGEARGANHHGHFINVLFFDGSVRTCEEPYLPPGVGSESGSIYVKETGDPKDTYIE
jgi:prepilin-type processing-associated H-X9-DG protein